MDIQRLVDIDKQVMLALNGSNSLYLDGVMKIYTSTVVWIPVALVLLFVVLTASIISKSPRILKNASPWFIITLFPTEFSSST